MASLHVSSSSGELPHPSQHFWYRWRPSPEDPTTFGSKILFTWLSPVIKHASQLPHSQLSLPRSLHTHALVQPFTQAWRRERSLVRAFVAVYGPQFVLAGMFRLVAEVCVLLSPVLLHALVEAAGREAGDGGGLFGSIGLCVLMFGVAVVQSLALQQFIHGVFMLAAYVVTIVSGMVFDKALRIRKGTIEAAQLGVLVNLQSKDAARLREFIVFVHNLWAAPLTSTVAIVMLYRLMGSCALVGVLMIALLVPAETWVAKTAEKYRKQVLHVADERLSLLKEVVEGIQTIKFGGCQDVFQQKVSRLRTDEMTNVRRALLLDVNNQVLMRASPILVALSTFALFTLTGGDLTPARAFTSLALFNALGHPLHVMPKAISLFADARVAIGRLTQFLNLEEKENDDSSSDQTDLPTIPPSPLSPLIRRLFPHTYQPLPQQAPTDNHTHTHDEEAPEDTTSTTTTTTNVKTQPEPTEDPCVVVDNASFSVNGERVLSGVTFRAERGLTLVIGRVGSGKSSLLLGLMDELGKGRGDGSNREGAVAVNGRRVAFCGESPWILNATVQENITMGQPGPIDRERYERCIHGCGLQDDIDEWPQGDHTIIGERGLTISGGQKARLALARALYSQCDIALLDDPLAAVDATVGSHVFRHAILELARRSVVVLATHQRHYLPHAQQIVVLDNQTVTYTGTHQALLAAGVDFPGMMKTAAAAADQQQQDDNEEQQDGDSVVSPTSTTDSTPARTTSFDTAQQPPLSQRQNKAADSHAKTKTSPPTVADKTFSGSVDRRVFTRYLQACGVQLVVAATMLAILAHLLACGKEVLLAHWSSAREAWGGYLVLYAVISVVTIGSNYLRFWGVCEMGLGASVTMHGQLLKSIMGAPLSFFQTTPSGRITSRFSSDIDVLDLTLPPAISSFTDAALSVISALLVIVGTAPLFVLPLVPLTYAYLRIQSLYRTPARELKRIDSATKSPIFSHFQEAVEGLPVIRALGIQAVMREKQFSFIDTNLRARLNWDATNRWLGVRLDLIGAFVILFAALFTSISRGPNAAGYVGLALAYALTVTMKMSFGVRASTALENHFSSVERIVEYMELEQEEEPRKMEGFGSPASMMQPSAGNALVVDRVVARYRPGLPPALKGVSLAINKGDTLGVCGRTGSGKSTLALALIRAVPYHGNIFLNGVSTDEMRLAALRSSITLIPQDATLFSGRVRDTLDPSLTAATDDQLWDVLSLVGMEDAVRQMPGQLNAPIGARGCNLSAGERQLLAIGRAICMGSCVLVLDEATARIDRQSNEVIQRLVHSHLRGRGTTVVVVAHRLEDVALCDSVCVMSEGDVVEHDTPRVLLCDPSSRFSSLVRDLGASEEQHMRQLVMGGQDEARRVWAR